MITVLKLAHIVTSNKHLQSWTQYLELSKQIKQNWTGLGNFEIY